MRKLILAAAVAALAAGCGHNIGAPGTTLHPADAPGGAAHANAPGGPIDWSDMTPEAARPYLLMAVASDLFEIQTSELAVQRATRPEVRQYAQMLVQHHRQTTQQLWAAARASGIARTHEWMLPPPAQAMLEQLQQASGADFDRLYIRQQVPAHQMALTLHGNYARNGDAPALRNVAGTAVPIVTQHLEQARQMMARVQ